MEKNNLQDNVVFEYKHTMNHKGTDGMFVVLNLLALLVQNYKY